MYSVNDKVLYGIHGVCTVADIQVKTVDRKKIEYYVLVPLDQPGASYFVPTGNAVAVSKLRPVLTKEALEKILTSPQTHADVWIKDENQRKQRYRELICSADTATLITMLRSIYRHRKQLLEDGKKFHLCDENFMRDAQRILSMELSVVLGLSREDTIQYMYRALND